VTVVPFRELGLEDVPRVGGKSAHLADLSRSGFPVPPGFAVTTGAFEAVVGNHVDALLAELDPDDMTTIEAKAEHVRTVVEGLDVPGSISAAVAEGYARLAGELGLEEPPVAVRSSAVAEDSAEASFAGMQSTYLSLRGAGEVLAGIRRCWASYFNAEALAYRARHGSAAGMSVAVQYMVDARVAGVMFTVNPVTGDPSSIAIDASYGLGVSVAEGEVTPDSYLVSKVTRELLRIDLGTKELEIVARSAGGVLRREVELERRSRPCLEPEEITRLVELGRDVERHYGRPQDVEWAIDRLVGEVFLLQARPVTTARRSPEAVVAGDPVAAIAAAMMGKLAR
jgi:pyruvate,water dikinase